MAKKLKVSFLGGIGEIGKNLTVIEYGDNILLVDAGLTFPSEEMLGVDIVIPDFTYLIQNKTKIKGVICTHGHEDHIGAIPFLMQEIDAPIFASKLTIGLIRHKMEDREIPMPKYKVVQGGSVETVDCFKVEFFKVCHSITGAMAVAITTPQGVIFHTGDFKIDHTPIDNEQMDFAGLADLGKKGVRLMLSDSTNVERPGHTISERTVGDAIDRIFRANVDRRIVVATFASNLHRIQQILDIAQANGRRVMLSGRSVLNVVEIGRSLGLIHYDDALVVNEAAMKKIPLTKQTIICTGSQGERESALSRMSTGTFPGITISDKDTVILSASPIPGNERSIYTVINNLYRLGAEVIYSAIEDVHTSGHAHQEELKMMLSLIKPQLFIPVHGEYRHLRKHALLANNMGVPMANILLPELGWSVEVSKEGLKRLPNVPAGNTYVDGAAVGDMETIIKDRIQMSNDGFLIMLLGMAVDSGTITTGPEIITRGMTGISDSDIEEIKSGVIKDLKNFKYINLDSRNDIKAAVRRTVRKIVYAKNQSRPMIVPIIVES